MNIPVPTAPMMQEFYAVSYSRRVVIRLLDIVIGFLEFLLAIRIFLRLLGANPDSPFVSWLYGTTDQLLAPFSGMFPSPVFSGYVIEFSTLFAMLVYAFAGWILIKIVSFLTDEVLGFN